MNFWTVIEIKDGMVHIEVGGCSSDDQAQRMETKIVIPIDHARQLWGTLGSELEQATPDKPKGG